MYKVGDTIRPIDDTGDFVITKINGNLLYANDEHEFEHTFFSHEVVQTNIKWATDISVVSPSPSDVLGRQKASKTHQKNKKKEWLEIDLHAGVLLGNTNGMPNHQIVTEQINAAKEALYNARKKGYNYVVLIHGKGSGKLRNELIKMLRGMERIEFYDAEFSNFSSGATEVRIY